MVYDAFITTPRGRSTVEGISADEVRELADAMGCRTQRDLAERLSITQSRVSQILSGAYPIKRGPLLTLVRTLRAEHVSRSAQTVVAAEQTTRRPAGKTPSGGKR